MRVALRSTIVCEFEFKLLFFLKRIDRNFNFQFDSISSNQRRKVLVGVSIPYAFDQTENDDEQQIEALDECERIDISEIFGDDDEQHEEEIDGYSSNSAIEHVEHVTVDVYSPETIVCDQPPEIVRIENKRKISESSSQNGTSQPMKLVKIDLNKSQHKNGIEATKRQHRKGNELLKLKRFFSKTVCRCTHFSSLFNSTFRFRKNPSLTLLKTALVKVVV